MITGKVVNRQAMIEIEVVGPSGAPVALAAVVDTGYNGALTLPRGLVQSLRLPFMGHRRGRLADGTSVLMSTHSGTIDWMGQPTEVLVAQVSGTPLVGMMLMSGSRLTIDAIEGGQVFIEELS